MNLIINLFIITDKNNRLEELRRFLLYKSDLSDPTVLNLWDESFELRKNMFDDGNNSIEKLLADWPLFTKSVAPTLVNIIGLLINYFEI